jgi:hypothetical protein
LRAYCPVRGAVQVWKYLATLVSSRRSASLGRNDIGSAYPEFNVIIESNVLVRVEPAAGERSTTTPEGFLVGRRTVNPYLGQSRKLAILVVASLCACSVCDRQEVARTRSSLGEVAKVMSVDCGATTDFATNVQVDEQVVLALRGKSAPSVRWAGGGRTLIVTVDQSLPERDLFQKSTRTREAGIVIERGSSR